MLQPGEAVQQQIGEEEQPFGPGAEIKATDHAGERDGDNTQGGRGANLWHTCLNRWPHTVLDSNENFFYSNCLLHSLGLFCHIFLRDIKLDKCDLALESVKENFSVFIVTQS